jgi:hypothetical protein
MPKNKIFPFLIPKHHCCGFSQYYIVFWEHYPLFHSLYISGNNTSSNTLFTVVKIWNPSRCPSTDEWLRKMWYIYTMEYPTIKKNEIMSFSEK